MKLALAAFTGFEITRPFGLVALLLPLAVWFLARAASGSRTLATGTLAIWRLVAERDARAGSARRRHLSPALVCVLAALVLGALALSAPRLSSTRIARTWRLYLDRRPAMFLGDAQSTRIARAALEARRWLAEVAHPSDEVIWITPNGAGLASVRAAEPPSEWLRAPSIPLDAPEWPALDRPDSVWITDRAPSAIPRHAVLVLAGGAAVPGPIDASGTTRWDWDGARIVEVPRGIEARRIAIEGELARPLAGVLAAWAAARGLSIDPSSRADVALRVHTRSEGDAVAIVAGRDGWRARGNVASAAASADEYGALQTWLSARVGMDERALITHGTGRVWSAWSTMEEPEGDPAAFAVSLASLFDACVLPAPGVVDLRDRLAAGAPEIRVPHGGPDASGAGAARVDDRGDDPRLDPWLALAALLATLAALGCVLIPRFSVRRQSGARQSGARQNGARQSVERPSVARARGIE